ARHLICYRRKGDRPLREPLPGMMRAQASPQFKVHLTTGGHLGEGLVRLLGLSGAVFAFSVLGAVSAFAQSPPIASPSAPQSAPLRGFVPPYEILRTVR